MPSVAQATKQSRRSSGGSPHPRHTVYLDYHASTPCDPRVLEAMLPFFLDAYANPSSSIHEPGKRAEQAVEKARVRVAAAICAQPGEIVFTGGATESNNLAILGSASEAPTNRRRILASCIEHKSVLGPCKALQERGFDFEAIPVDRDGLLDLGALVDLIGEDTFLVCVQAVNNEIGTIQPILEVVQIAHGAGAVVQCDAAQALGRILVDVGDWGVDLLSLSSHKCYGPKGIGALYIRGGARNAPLAPLLYGGGQEHDLRPGTLNVPGIVGFGCACEIAEAEREADSERVQRLRDHFEEIILSTVLGARRNGSVTRRVASNSSLTLPGVEAEALIANLREIAISTGSACTSGAPDPSHVLMAIGLSREDAYRTFRIGLGRFTMESETRYAAERLTGLAAEIQKNSISV